MSNPYDPVLPSEQDSWKFRRMATLVRTDQLPPPRYIDFETYKPRWEDLTFQSEFRPRRYQKDALHFINRYSYGGNMRDYMRQGLNGMKVFGLDAASVFGRDNMKMDYAAVEARIVALWAEMSKPLAERATPNSVWGIA
jgi:hypothetical protein